VEYDTAGLTKSGHSASLRRLLAGAWGFERNWDVTPIRENAFGSIETKPYFASGLDGGTVV
jgi:hypothetical protein